MATYTVSDANLQPVEIARLIESKRREQYESGLRNSNASLDLDVEQFEDRDEMLYADVHRSPTANL